MRRCQNPACRKALERTLYPGGTLESVSKFKRRRYCSRACGATMQNASGPKRTAPARGGGGPARRGASLAADFIGNACLPPARPAMLTPSVADRLGPLGPRLEVACLEHPMLASFLAELALGESTRGRRLAA